MIIGKAGTGKSTLINNLLDSNIAKVGHYQTGTYDVNKYSIRKYDTTFNIYDTPGLFDPNINMKQIFDKISEVDSINLFLICYDISEARLTQNDLQVFETLKYQYSKDIMKHSVLVFTKSNLLEPNTLKTISEMRYKKLELNIPAIYGYDSRTNNGWKDLIWDQMVKQSKKEQFLLKANDLRVRVCEPAKKVTLMDNIYPSYVNQLMVLKYNSCIERKNNEKSSMGFFGAFLALAGFVVFTVLTGGGAAVLGGLATAGMGSVATGGLGIIGGVSLLGTAGFLGGITLSEMQNVDCRNYAINEMSYEINKCHYDTFVYDNNVIAFEGTFCNNRPHGDGTIFERNGNVMWKGNFKNGIPDICY
jgi:small GTP-binding protein